jgi:hypothetical protein
LLLSFDFTVLSGRFEFFVSGGEDGGVVPGSERRVFRVPTGTNTRKFLRIGAENP